MQKTVVLLSVVVLTLAIFQVNPHSKATATPHQDATSFLSQQAASEWQRLTVAALSPLDARWDQTRGTLETVFGKIPTRFNQVSELAAREFLWDYRDLFGLKAELDDLVLVREVGSPAGRHYTFEQRHQGLPVYGGSLSVHFDLEGYVRVVNNHYVPAVEISSTTPTVEAESAIGMASRRVGLLSVRDGEESTAELVVYADGREAKLAWRVVIPAREPLGTWQVFVDAHSRAVIAEPRDLNRYKDGQGRVYGSVNAVVATQNSKLTDQRDADAAVPSEAYTLVALKELAENGYLDGPFVSTSGTPRGRRANSPTGQFLYFRSDDRFEEVMVYHFIDYCQRYIQSLDFTEVNNRQQIVAVNTIGVDNSYYDPSNRRITYGSGGVDDAEDAEVIWHEYGHAIQDNQVPGFGVSVEAGAMGEGFGDYLAASIGSQLSRGFQDECVADWDAVSYSMADPPCLRRVDSRKHYPEDMVDEVHRDGEIWSASLWQIRLALGGEKADRVIIQSHFLLSRTARFRDGANAILTAADALKYPKPEQDAIRNIFIARGIL